MVAPDHLRATLQWLHDRAVEAESNAGYSAPYQSGFGHALVQVGYRFGLMWARPGGGIPDELNWVRQPDHNTDLRAALAAELKRLASKNRPAPRDMPEDLECMRGIEAVLVAVAERCDIALDEVGID